MTDAFEQQQPGAARQILDDLVSTVFAGERLWRSIAWALILLLAAGHLRRWLSANTGD